jgi:hypothetical protein
MKRNWWLVAIAALAVVLYGLGYFPGGGQDTIEYRGGHFKMSQRYSSYEVYKDDPNNLDTNELSRIEKAMLEANIGKTFDSREQFSRAVFGVKFPGYGLSSLGEKTQADGSVLTMMSVEIPQRDKDRYFVARKSKNHLILVDDFVANAGSNTLSQVKLDGSRLLYTTDKGVLVREHQMSQE